MSKFGGTDFAKAARAALDLRFGRTLTDAEWARASARLIEFVNILRGWEQCAGEDSVPRLPEAA